MKRIVHVVGARPNFMKVAPIMRVMARCAESFDQVLVHTGQHYDFEMSEVFFRDLDLPSPDYNLDVGSGPHGKQTGQMMVRLEEVVLHERPDWVLVYGDTNSTLAGALVAAKLQIPAAHVEAGLRSFNRAMPEEINRVVADHLCQLLFCPSQDAAENLRREGISDGGHVVGDVMYDAILRFLPVVSALPSLLGSLDLPPGGYALATVHRAENTDDHSRLGTILDCLAAARLPVVFPTHPRTAQALSANRYRVPPNVRLVKPVGYLEMLALERHARVILTDSGGVQKEAFWLGTPCVTLREETEWVETVEAGWNEVVGVDPERVRSALAKPRPAEPPPLVYGDGHAAEQIAQLIVGGT